MIVDTSDTSLGNFGIYLPNLKQLKLSSSFVPRIRLDIEEFHSMKNNTCTNNTCTSIIEI